MLPIFIGFFGLFFNEPVYETISQQIQKKYESETLRPMGISITSLGGSSKKGIKTIHMGVATKGPGTIEDSRRLMVYLLTTLIQNYNDNPSIRPYLLDYPFTAKNIDFTISFNDPTGLFWVKDKSKNDEEQIAYVTNHHGVLNFMVDDSGELGSLRSVAKEMFEDSVRIVQREKF